MVEAGQVRCPLFHCPPAAELPTAIAVQWVEAFNRRDIEGLLACVTDDIDLHPLTLRGFAQRYRGRDGLREWFGRLQDGHHEHRIALDAAREVGGSTVFMSGMLMLAEGLAIGPICALHWIEHGLISATREYHTDPETMERIGMIPRH